MGLGTLFLPRAVWMLAASFRARPAHQLKEFPEFESPVAAVAGPDHGTSWSPVACRLRAPLPWMTWIAEAPMEGFLYGVCVVPLYSPLSLAPAGLILGCTHEPCVPAPLEASTCILPCIMEEEAVSPVW